MFDPLLGKCYSADAAQLRLQLAADPYGTGSAWKLTTFQEEIGWSKAFRSVGVGGLRKSSYLALVAQI